ncbi:MAG TPA: PAAR-like protein [Chthoniobacter sp.]|nr:PAAR-like protein [Chthoniobacter sp.]
MANIPSFGVCAILTAAALGVPTPCTPAPTGAWTPGSVSPVQMSGIPALLATDTLVCGVGGVIKVSSPGQATASAT